MAYRLVRTSDGVDVIPHLEVADSFWKRTLGLLGRRGLDAGSGLLLEPCSSVHMFFMRFPIDVVYSNRCGDDEMRIRKLVPGLMPWQVSMCLGADLVVELPAGAALAGGLQVGDYLTVMPVPTGGQPGQAEVLRTQ